MRQERFLSEAGEALSEQLRLDHLYDLITRLPVPYLADACALDVLDNRGKMQRVASHGELIERLLPFGSAAIDEVLNTGSTQVLSGSEAHTGYRSSPRQDDSRASCLAMRLSARGRLLGVLSIARSDPERSCGRDIMLAQAYAQRVAFALDNVSLYEEASKARNLMADTVRVLSHEFRTPLSSVLGYADLMLAGIAGPITERQRTYLGSVRSSAWHLGRLVDDVLSGSRIDDQPDEPVIVNINLSALIDDIANVISPECSSKGLSLDVSCPDDFVIVSDLGKLRQILLNLAGNAVKFTRVGGIRIEAESRMSGAQVAVIDTGPGLSADDALHVFDEYWQGADASHAGGVGLGLALSRRLARALGGDITVESAPGQGCRFTMWVPGGL